MNTAETILEIKWTMEDILQIFSDADVSVTEENIGKIVNDRNLRILEEQSIERGWEVLGNMMREVDRSHSG